MAQFIYLQESRTYINIDHVTAVTTSADAESATVALVDRDKDEEFDGADAKAIIRVLNNCITS